MSGYGLALGGGGAKGGYHIGVWKALCELEIPIEIITGTSVGAINGAMIIQDDFETAYKLWTDISIQSVIEFNLENGEAENFPRKGYGVINSIIRSICFGGLDMTPLKQLISQVIHEKKVRESNIDLGIVTFSLTDFKPINLFKKDIPDGQLTDYIVASACFPTFKTHKIDDKILIDGGVYDNIPISLLIDKSVKNIISVDISGPGIVKKIDSTGLNIITIKNSQGLGGTLDFNGERSKINIEIGYNDTLKTFGKIKGKKYYIIPSEDENINKEKYLQSLTPEDFTKMYEFLGLTWSGKPSTLNNIIIYKIMSTIRKYADGKLSGDTVFPAMAEITAEQLGLKPKECSTLGGLLEQILNEYKSINTSKDFNQYKYELTNAILNGNHEDFIKGLRQTLKETKLLIFYNPTFNKNDDKIKVFRRFLAMTFPKISIANMFIALLLSKEL